MAMRPSMSRFCTCLRDRVGLVSRLGIEPNFLVFKSVWRCGNYAKHYALDAINGGFSNYDTHQRGSNPLSLASLSNQAYAHANKLFLEAVAGIYEEGDIVLVHDYDLMLLPALLRKRFPDITCGFFLHCPFPSTGEKNRLQLTIRNPWGLRTA